ncbi:DASH family cryptochrome [Shewanella subflava]|uniref:Cryptochrome DASH n=1 Tax=Shewanella subflava TaxID=2986476 RepID=A0ABT3I611_9GAMM|nr:DASH family cryptochrome [Shewanella subflava]MCW3171497.1 DASH family cryptochrome [Shewanella subflava]
MSLYRSLFCFSTDLRLTDNLALSALISRSSDIAFVFVFDENSFKPNYFQQTSMGKHRLAFLLQSLEDLSGQLNALGHKLHLCYGEPVKVITDIVDAFNIEQVGYSQPVGWNERVSWQKLHTRLSETRFVSQWSNSLFSEEQIKGVDLTSFSFSQFRRHVEAKPFAVSKCCQTWLGDLPQPLMIDTQPFQQADSDKLARLLPHPETTPLVLGGEKSAQAHLLNYFSQSSPSTYKATRNELDGFENSTKFSPFLAIGNLSARQIWAALRQYEAIHGANDSTYWIGFELLWREYFHWLTLTLGKHVFRFKGMKTTPPLTCFLPERFTKWCQGNTPFPLVNACMKQLNATGYMSNRGRQIVASCLVNELRVDWRYGAAYFEHQLIDYDVASNWCNWQYIAGVGVDPRGGRHFNIAKQAQTYDPNNRFIQLWQGDKDLCSLDSVDAADWPMSAE